MYNIYLYLYLYIEYCNLLKFSRCNLQVTCIFFHVLAVDNHTSLLLPLYFNSAVLNSIMSLVCDW